MQATTWACACSESSRGCDAADGVRDATLHVGSPSLSLLPAALPVAWCAASIAMPHKEQTDEIYLVDMKEQTPKTLFWCIKSVLIVFPGCRS